MALRSKEPNKASDKEDVQRLERLIGLLWDDRVSFVREILGVIPSWQQEQALRALDSDNFVAVKSGIQTGKTALMSWTLLHYMCTRPEPKIICTSPSKDQLKSVLWPELLMWHNKLPSFFREQFIWYKESYTHAKNPKWFALSRTASKDNPESLQGFHADYVMRLIDEGSGTPNEVFEVLEGATGNKETKELLCGNPTKLSGVFYEAFNKNAEFYKTFTWSSLDSPLRNDRVLERMKKKYGESSNMWRVRVLGEFPFRDGDSFIPYDMAMDAINRDVVSQVQKPKVFGCDIARYGDDFTCIAIRQGDKFEPYHILRSKSTMETAAYIAYLANKERPSAIFVDSIGIGSGVVDRLESLGFPVVPVNVAELPALDGQKYKRLRDELWGLMRDWLEQRRGSLWDNEEMDLVGQLTTLQYDILANGKIQIETKEKLRSRNIDSPNIADAHVMTFAQPVASYTAETDNFWEDFYNPNTGLERVFDSEVGY